MARDELLEVDRETRATISTVIMKLRNIHQRCLDDPSYTVALALPRKPPLLQIQTQTPALRIHMIRISAKMAQNQSSREQNQSNDMTMPITNSYYPESNHFWPEEFHINLPSMQPEGVPIMYPFTNSRPLQTLQELGPSNISDIPRSNSIEQGIVNRRRNYDEITDHSDGEQECRRKVRKKKKPPPRHSGRNTAENFGHRESRDLALSSAKTAEEDTLFACPFYHHDPMNTKYRTKTWQSCAGPGWTIPRLKLVTPLPMCRFGAP